MAQVTVLKSAWDAVAQGDKDAASWVGDPTFKGGIFLNDPAVWTDGTDDYYVWDDHRLSEDHALAVAAAVEGI